MSPIWVLLFSGLMCKADAQTPDQTPQMKEIFERRDRVDKQNAQLRKENEDLQRKVQRLWTLNHQGSSHGDRNVTGDNIHQEVGDVESQGERTAVDRVDNTFTTNPAFLAILSRDVNNAQEYQVIPFDQIVTNVGRNFNTHGTGIFHCTIPGTYVFHWTVCVKDHQMAFAVLVKNGHGITLATSGRDELEYSTGSGSAVVELNVGDDVLLQVRDPRNSADISQDFTTFSGFLLN